MDDPLLAEAQRLFNQAEYDSAVVVLQELAADETLPVETKRETFRLLGLVHTIRGSYDAAKASIRNWIATEPPIVVPDPDRDMLEFVYLYYEVRKALNEQKYCGVDFRPPDPCQFVIGRPDPGIKTVAVVSFDNNAIDERKYLEPLTGGLSDLMVRQLSGVTGLKIVEREWLNWLLKEIELNETELADVQIAVRIGKLLGAHSVLIGDFMYLADTFTIGARLVKVESSEVLLVASQEGKLSEIGALSGRLSEELARAILPKVESGEWKSRTPTNDLGAMLSYAEGLAFYDRGDHEAAAEKFSEALRLDPNHRPARQRYNAVRPMVASYDGPR